MLAKKILNQSAIYGAASILVNGSGFLLLPLYTRALSTQEYGIISSTNIVSLIITYSLSFGLSGSISRFYFEFDNNEKWRVFFFTTSLFLIFNGLLITLFLSFFGGSILDQLFKSVRFDPYLKYGIWIGYFGGFSLIPLALFQVKGKALLYRIMTTLSFILLTGFMIYLVVIKKQEAIGALRAQLISVILVGMVYLYFIYRESHFKINMSYLKITLRFGLPIMIYMITGVFVELSSKYFIEKYTTLSDLGVYNLAQQYASSLVLIISAINLAWVPIFYEKASKDINNKKPFEKFGNVFMIIVITLGFLISLFSKEILTVLASKDYQQSYTIVPIIALAYIFGNGFWILIVNPISFVKKTIYLIFLTLISSSTSILFNIILIPKIGVYGAAWSLFISYLVITIVGLLLVNKIFTVKYDYFKISLVLVIAVVLFVINNTIIKYDYFAIKLCLVLLYTYLLFFLKIISPKQIKVYFKQIFKS